MISAPPALMKSANAYGSPSSAAHSALCGEEPSSHGSGSSGRPGSALARRANGWSGGKPIVEIAEQLHELLGKVVRRRRAPVALQGEGGQRVGARRAPERQVDAAREQAGQQAEGLRDLEGAVVGEHHAAAAHPDTGGRGGDRADQRLGARSGEHRPAVVLGDPVAVIAEPIRQARQIERVLQCLRARGSLGHRRLVEDERRRCSAAIALTPSAAPRPPRRAGPRSRCSPRSRRSHAADAADARHAAAVAEPGDDGGAADDTGAEDDARAAHDRRAGHRARAADHPRAGDRAGAADHAGARHRRGAADHAGAPRSTRRGAASPGRDRPPRRRIAVMVRRPGPWSAEIARR